MRRFDPELLDNARHNRQTMNHAEARLWWDLRKNRFGVKFRRQHITHGYILDFACLSLKLDIEVDGSQHFRSPLDKARDERLRQAGWTILRVWSWDVYRDNEAVLTTIGQVIAGLQAAKASGSGERSTLPPR